MNCEICAVTFTRLKDLVRHAASENHGYSKLYCLPCSLALRSSDEVMHHIISKEHSIIALATGVHFCKKDKCPDPYKASFPAHNLCLLCSNRDGTPNNDHLTSEMHRCTAWLLRAVMRSKKLFCYDQGKPNTKLFISKLLNAKQKNFLGDTRCFQNPRRSLPFVCQLCNLHFNKLEYYNQHLQDPSHKGTELFLIKMSRLLRDVDIIGDGIDTCLLKTFSNSLRALYYCEVCFLWIDTIFNYIQHRKSNRHKNAELIMKRSMKKKFEVAYLQGAVSAGDIHPKSSESEKCSSLLKCEGHKIEQCFTRDASVIHDCCSERPSKMSKTPLSSLDSHFMGYEHQKKQEIMKTDPCYGACARTPFDFDARETNSYSSRRRFETDRNYYRSEFEGRETARGYSRFGFEAAESATRYPRLGFKDYENDRHPRFAFEPRERAISRLRYEASESGRNYPQLGREVDEKARRSSRFRVENRLTDRPTARLSFEDSKTDKLSPPLFSFEDEDANSDQEHYCELCDYLSYSSLQYEKHLRGEQHKRMMKLINKKEKKSLSNMEESELAANATHPLRFNCELCDMFNHSSQEYDFHMNSAMHRKNQWLLYVLKQRPL